MMEKHLLTIQTNDLSLIGLKKLVLTAPLRYGEVSANMNSSAINKQCAYRQVSASNPPQRKAANRYQQGQKDRQY